MSLSRLPIRRTPLVSIMMALAALGCQSGTGPESPFTHPSGQQHTRSIFLTGRPFGVAVSQSEAVLVGLQDEARLAVLPLSATPALGSIEVGSLPTDVRVSPDGGLAAVSNQWSGSVGFVDLASETQATAVLTSAQPYRVLFSADGLRLYVSNNSGEVDIIDVVSRRRIGSVHAGDAANGLALSPDGLSLYVSSMNGEISVVDLSGTRVARTILLTGMPQGIAVSPDGAQLYVAREAGSAIAVLDANSGVQTDSIHVGPGGFDLVLTPDGTQLYATFPSSGLVMIVDRASRQVVQSLALGGSPRRVAFTRSGDAAVVGNESGWVDIIR